MNFGMLNKQKGYLEHRFQEEIIELPIPYV